MSQNQAEAVPVQIRDFKSPEELARWEQVNDILVRNKQANEAQITAMFLQQIGNPIGDSQNPARYMLVGEDQKILPRDQLDKAAFVFDIEANRPVAVGFDSEIFLALVAAYRPAMIPVSTETPVGFSMHPLDNPARYLYQLTFTRDGAEGDPKSMKWSTPITLTGSLTTTLLAYVLACGINSDFMGVSITTAPPPPPQTLEESPEVSPSSPAQ